MRTVNVDGYEKTYKVGMTQKEYTPWAKVLQDKENHPILGSYMTDYLNRADVRRALHIPNTLPGWQQCNNRFQDFWHYQYEASEWIYKVLKPYGYKILFYSGDTDGCVPTYGTRQWINDLGWPILEDWRPWTTGNQTSGFITKYDGLTFVTVHGVGHMSPQWKRQDVTRLITNWLWDLTI